MKHSKFSKTKRQTGDLRSDSCVQRNAVSIAPPDYGLDFVDRGYASVENPAPPTQLEEDLEEEVPLQGKFAPAQGHDDPEEEELLQGKFTPLQLQDDPEDEELLQGKFAFVQLQVDPDEEELLQGKFASTVKPMQFATGPEPSVNRTGLPNQLKSGLEQLGGFDLSGVRVHFNSSKPAQLNALAYTQGQEIHVGPGQEKHLPHEGWHAVQQMQGRVKPTMQAKGVSINDDNGLEREADVMGARALQQMHLDQNFGNAKVSNTFSQFQRKPGCACGDGFPNCQTNPLRIQRKVEQPPIQRKLSGDFTIPQLRTYLQELDRTGQINGTDEGDDMARDVVSAWRDDLTFSLTPRRKILLIRELQDGTVGDDDEQAILALLQHSYNDEMSNLFGPGGINVDDLDSDMQGDEQDELDAFYESRFQGGKEAVRRGEIRTLGRQEPLLPTSEAGWNRARVEDCMHQPSGVLPGRIGLLAEMHRSRLVSEHFSTEELTELEQLIRADPQARRFVCTNGLPGLLAVSDTRNGTAIDIGAARTLLASGEMAEEINRPFLRRQRQARETVGDVTEWAHRESRPITVPSMASIVGLPEEHRTALERVLQLLQRNTVDVGRLSGAFQQAVTAATDTPTRIQEIRDSSLWRQGRFPYEEANNASSSAEAVVTAIQETNRYMEVTDLIQQARSIQASLESLPRNYRGELSAEQAYEARDQLRTLKQNARTLRQQIRERAQRMPSAESFERVHFLLTYFLAMNDSDGDASTAAERQQFAAAAANFNDDLRAVFGTGATAVRSPVELLEVLGSRLGEQMSVRNQMAQRLNQDPGAVPGMVNVRAYFRSLRGEPLATIEQAYENYAGAYFEHRVLNSQADLEVDEFSDLFNRPIGIGGTRRLVCTGFARLGAQLLVDAGATLVRYRIRFHYTPADVAAQSFSDGHAVARLRLGRTHVWVSNQSIFHSLDQAMDVDWTNPDAPHTDGRGATLEAATTDLNLPSN